MPINAGSLSPKPLMELTFRVQVAAFTSSPPSGLHMGSTETWVLNPRVLQCDIAPMKDDLYFGQTGVETAATHVYHFYANSIVQVKNRIHVLSNKRLAGPIGSWFEITARLEPTETIAFVRCYGRLTDAPPL